MTIKLYLTENGTAELRRGEDVLWNSADDESFGDEFPDDVLTEDDLPEILEYLVSEDHLTAHEADNIEIEDEGADEDDGEEEDEEAIADDDGDEY